MDNAKGRSSNTHAWSHIVPPVSKGASPYVSFTATCSHEAHGSSSRYSDISMNMYDRGDDAFPCLKGKAAEVRHFTPILHDVFKSVMIPDNKQHRQIELILGFCCNLETIMDKFSDSYKLPADAAEPFRKSAWGFFS